MKIPDSTFKLVFALIMSVFILMGGTTAHAINSTLPDGQHNFDFNIGTWDTHISRLVKPLSGSKNWTELDGIVTVKQVWKGKAQIEEIEAGGASGNFEGLTLFLYNPDSHQWSMSFANSDDGHIDNPTVGSFKDGKGLFYQQSTYHGKSIMVRMIWSDIKSTSHRVEQSYSDDGGKTWEPNFIGILTKRSPIYVAPVKQEEMNHDFDFAIGSWKEKTSRLQHPLTNSTTWTEMEGKSVVYTLWNGKASLTELQSNGTDGNLELLALCLYNPQAKQWNLTFATSKVGVLGLPAMAGEIKNGHGEFYDQEVLGTKAIWVRYKVLSISADSMQSEQAFSDDGGVMWETNWINKYTRIKD